LARPRSEGCETAYSYNALRQITFLKVIVLS
jgi:hypothetical protein